MTKTLIWCGLKYLPSLVLLHENIFILSFKTCIKITNHGKQCIILYHCGFSIITHLETLKTEAVEIATKVEETDVVIAEVERVSQQYVPLAQSCSSIYFTLEALNQV